jgi:hypothetical protein
MASRSTIKVNTSATASELNTLYARNPAQERKFPVKSTCRRTSSVLVPGNYRHH